MANENMEPTGGSGAAKWLLGLVVVAVVAVGAYYVFGRDGELTGEETPTPSATATATATPTPAATASPTASTGATKTPTPASAVKTFNVSATSFSFNLKTITVNKGDTVKIVVTNSGGQHDFVIDEFNKRTPILGSGQSSTIEFVADKTGTFEYYCSVGTHRQMGMKGNLIVL